MQNTSDYNFIIFQTTRFNQEETLEDMLQVTDEEREAVMIEAAEMSHNYDLHCQGHIMF